MDKRVKTLIIAIAIALVVAIASTSYAFFTISNKEGEETVIKSGTMGLHLEDGPEVGLENAIPGTSVTKTFYVENTGNVATAYDLYLSEVVNTFVDKTDLVYTLTSNDGGYSTTGQVQAPSTSAKIVDSEPIEVGGIHHYTLVLTFLEKNEVQDDNQGVEFKGKIQINEYSDGTGNSTDIESCPNCKFAYYLTDYNTSTYQPNNYFTFGSSATPLTNTELALLKDNYQDIISESGKQYFLGLDIDEDTNIVNKIYACGIHNNNAFCIEGTTNGSSYTNNSDLLLSLYGNFCMNKTYQNSFYCEYKLKAETYQNGLVYTGINNDLCVIEQSGKAYCTESSSVSNPTATNCMELLEDWHEENGSACDLLTTSCDLSATGNEVRIGSEHFYVMGREDSTHVKLLSKYNLLFGDMYGYKNLPNYETQRTEYYEFYPLTSIPTTVETYGKQNKLAIYSSWDSNHTLSDGTNCSYAGSKYFDTVSEPNYAESIVKPYVDNYVSYLNSLGVNVTGRIVNDNDMVQYGCTGSGMCDLPSWFVSGADQFFVDNPGNFSSYLEPSYGRYTAINENLANQIDYTRTVIIIEG